MIGEGHSPLALSLHSFILCSSVPSFIPLGKLTCPLTYIWNWPTRGTDRRGEGRRRDWNIYSFWSYLRYICGDGCIVGSCSPHQAALLPGLQFLARYHLGHFHPLALQALCRWSFSTAPNLCVYFLNFFLYFSPSVNSPFINKSF